MRRTYILQTHTVDWPRGQQLMLALGTQKENIGNARREVAELRRCFVGVCTWHRVCESFGFDVGKLPKTVAKIRT